MSGEDRREAIRMRGRIVDVVRAPAWLVLARGQKKREIVEDGELVLDVNGERVHVEVPGRALCDPPQQTHSDWLSLRDSFDGKRFPHAFAPGWAKVELRVARLAGLSEGGAAIGSGAAVGLVVEVYGEVVERAFLDDGGLRDAPSQRVAKVRALLLASGASCGERLDHAISRRYPPARQRHVPADAFERWLEKRAALAAHPASREPASRIHRGSMVLFAHHILLIAFAAIVGSAAVVKRTPMPVAWTFVLASMIVVYRPRPVVPTLREGTRVLDRIQDGSVGWWLSTYLLFLPALPVLHDEPLGLVIAALVLVAIELLRHALVSRTHASLARIRRAPRWNGQPGTYGSFTGTVQDPTPARVGDADVAMGVSVGFSESASSNPDREVWQRFHVDGTFLVATEHGAIEVAPLDIVWSTTVSGLDYPDDGSADYATFDIIPVGAKVVGVGQIVRGERGLLRLGRSDEPAILVAAGPLGEPAQWLARVGRSRRMTLVLIGTLGAIGIALAMRFAG